MNKKDKNNQLKIPIKEKSLVHTYSKAIALLKESGFIALEPRFLQRKPDPFSVPNIAAISPYSFPFSCTFTHPPALLEISFLRFKEVNDRHIKASSFSYHYYAQQCWTRDIHE